MLSACSSDSGSSFHVRGLKNIIWASLSRRDIPAMIASISLAPSPSANTAGQQRLAHSTASASKKHMPFTLNRFMATSLFTLVFVKAYYFLMCCMRLIANPEGEIIMADREVRVSAVWSR